MIDPTDALARGSRSNNAADNSITRYCCRKKRQAAAGQPASSVVRHNSVVRYNSWPRLFVSLWDGLGLVIGQKPPSSRFSKALRQLFHAAGPLPPALAREPAERGGGWYRKQRAPAISWRNECV